MKFFLIIIVVVFGLIYWPINIIYTKVHKWYFKQKKEDIVIWYLFTPFYWILVAIVTIISVPYEEITKRVC